MVYNDQLKREIPADWEVKCIGSILDRVPVTRRLETQEYKSEGKYPIVDQDSSVFIAGYTDEEEAVKRYPAVLFGDHSTCVKFLNFEFVRGADGTQILFSKEKRVTPYYLYLAVEKLPIPNKGYSRHFKYLKELPIILPAEDIVEQFEYNVKCLYTKKTLADNENKELEKLRDRLLPLLMNGQVSIENLP